MIVLANLSGEYLNLFLAGIFGMVLLSIALVVFFVVYQRRIFAQERKREEEEKAHQKELLIAAVEVQEAERRRIAGDLHDDIGSLLSATRLYLRQLKADAPIEKNTEIRDQALSILDEMIQNTRRITHDLLPPTLEKFGLQAAAEDMCERINKSGGIKVNFRSDTDVRLDPKKEVAIYRVLQELFNNTLKHAKAKTIDVSIGQKQDSFSFVYADDGKGFDPAAIESVGLGLRNIESRVSLIGGNLKSTTSPGNGLTVTVTLTT
ncbi:sensor histidine kinase [Neolewinella aurantiaca]|uniref:histidine kinase n=1 Tax=Neolewinella aurantiaca TaxID=2602767 RepID=A0A5C7FLP8_9BACT|nr:sensor histidine kinase [Neolewinella aurantiaca]TXF91630.1 sensor histidine kinase [Neolewinella aurantiaca]